MGVIAKPTIPEVLPLVNQLYLEEDPCTKDAGCVGGHLHIVLDDGNIEDGCVQFCLDQAIEDNCPTCRTIAEQLMQMSKTQRKKIASTHV